MTFKAGLFTALIFSFVFFQPAFAKESGQNKGFFSWKGSGAEKNKAADKKKDEQLDEAEQQINEFNLAGYGEKGKKDWDISGESADIMNETVELQKVVGNLYGKEEDVKLTADKGAFNRADGKMNLRENVVITSSSGTKMVTDSLDWDRKAQVVTTADVVNIENKDMMVVGKGAHGEPNLKKMSLEKDVKLDIKPVAQTAKSDDPLASQEKVEVICDGPLEIDYQNNVATFRNNVVVTRADSTIYSDKMDVYFIAGKKNPAPEQGDAKKLAGGKIDKIVASGNVKVVQGGNISYSQEAIYSAADRKIILTGRPKLVITTTGGDQGDAPFGN